MTLDQVDRYIIFVFGLWFIAKAILFTTTWYVSWKLMKGNVRTRLSAAQHLLFLGLAIVGSAMGPAFLLSYFSGTGLMAADPRIEPYWITVVIRALLLIGLAIVTVAGARSFVAQYKRYHGIEDDPDDDGQVVIDTKVAETIDHTAADVSEVRERVERIEAKIDDPP